MSGFVEEMMREGFIAEIVLMKILEFSLYRT